MATTYVSFTYVDAITGTPVSEEPADQPAIPEGCAIDFTLESRRPAPYDIFYGTTTGSPLVRGVTEITKTEYDRAYANEMAARGPIVLTVGEFVGRFVIPDEDDAFADLDDAMMAESRLVKRNWQNSAYSFTQGDGFWTIVSGHLDAIVTPERKAELLGRSAPAFAATAEFIAA